MTFKQYIAYREGSEVQKARLEREKARLEKLKAAAAQGNADAAKALEARQKLKDDFEAQWRKIN